MSIQSLLDYISVIPDIRQQGKVKHKLSAILFLTVCAVIAGADEWQEIEDFGHERLEWLKKYGIVVDDVCKEKPPAICYIDDRAICFDGNAKTLLEKIQSFKPWNK